MGAAIFWNAYNPAVKKAFIEARNRASQASLADRKAALKRAAVRLCVAFEITRDDLNQVMIAGRDVSEGMKWSEEALKNKDAQKAKDARRRVSASS